MPESRSYPISSERPVTLPQLQEGLESWLQSKGLETQAFPGGDSFTIQAKGKDWLKWFWASSAFTVTAATQEDRIAVQVGAAKWVDKVASGVISLLVFLPLVAVPAWGAYRQKELMDETYDFVQRFVSSGGNVPLPQVGMSLVGKPERAKIACPRCGREANVGTKFCSSCGASLPVKAVCSHCGAELTPSAKFCPSCGTAVKG